MNKGHPLLDEVAIRKTLYSDVKVGDTAMQVVAFLDENNFNWAAYSKNGLVVADARKSSLANLEANLHLLEVSKVQASISVKSDKVGYMKAMQVSVIFNDGGRVSDVVTFLTYSGL